MALPIFTDRPKGRAWIVPETKVSMAFNALNNYLMEAFDSNYFLVTLLRFKDWPRDRDWIVPGTKVSIACIALNNLLNGSFCFKLFLSNTIKV